MNAHPPTDDEKAIGSAVRYISEKGLEAHEEFAVKKIPISMRSGVAHFKEKANQFFDVMDYFEKVAFSGEKGSARFPDDFGDKISKSLSDLTGAFFMMIYVMAKIGGIRYLVLPKMGRN